MRAFGECERTRQDAAQYAPYFARRLIAYFARRINSKNKKMKQKRVIVRNLHLLCVELKLGRPGSLRIACCSSDI